MRTDLAIPYADSGRVKALGAKWDMGRKVWYVPDGVDLYPFLEWVSKMPVLNKQTRKALKKGRK